MSDFESHQVRARDPLLSPNERSAFGSYRDGVTTATADDIFSKLSSQLVAGLTLVDIGCGC